MFATHTSVELFELACISKFPHGIAMSKGVWGHSEEGDQNFLLDPVLKFEGPIMHTDS